MIVLLLISTLILDSQSQELQKEADPPLNCPGRERARRGDRILLDYTGLLADGSTFDRGSADFVIGDGTVIAGFEQVRKTRPIGQDPESRLQLST